MIFEHDKQWIEETNKRCVRRTIITGIITVILVVAAIITQNTFLYILAGISLILFVPELFVGPKRKLYQEAHSVEVTDQGLVIRNLNHEPICLKWENLQLKSKTEKNNKIESITLMENTGIGKVELDGLTEMSNLDSILNEKLNGL